MPKFTRLVIGAMSLSMTAAALAQQPIIYPAKGQTPQQQSLINALLGVAAPPLRRSSPARGRLLARRAEEYIRGQIDAPITLSDICDWVGASERSLHLGFLEEFGISPMAYLKVLRLNRVRRQLRDAAPGISVTDVAMRAGFSHLGRFATDYGRFFGERPSATLRHFAQ